MTPKTRVTFDSRRQKTTRPFYFRGLLPGTWFSCPSSSRVWIKRHSVALATNVFSPRDGSSTFIEEGAEIGIVFDVRISLEESTSWNKQ